MYQTSRSLAFALLGSAAFVLSQPAAGFDFSPGRWMNPGNWLGGNRDDDYYRGGPQGYYAPAPGYYQAPPPGYGYGYAQPAYQVPTQPYSAQPTYQAPAQPYSAQPAYQAPAQPYSAQPAYQAPVQPYGGRQVYQAPATSVQQTPKATQSAPPRRQPTRTAAPPAYPPMAEPRPGSGGYVPEGYLSEIPDEYPVGSYVPEGYMADVPDDGAPAQSSYPPKDEPATQADAHAPQGYSVVGQ